MTVTAAAESVTNTQHAGVDEGGIVKVHGDHLVVLRRGRLFTIAINGGELKPISTVDAFGPGINPESSWYDEMLISDNTVVVIGYSYNRGGTEVGLFDISNDGQLSLSLNLICVPVTTIFASLCQPYDRKQANLLHSSICRSVSCKSRRIIPSGSQVARRSYGRRVSTYCSSRSSTTSPKRSLISMTV